MTTTFVTFFFGGVAAKKVTIVYCFHLFRSSMCLKEEDDSNGHCLGRRFVLWFSFAKKVTIVVAFFYLLLFFYSFCCEELLIIHQN